MRSVLAAAAMTFALLGSMAAVHAETSYTHIVLHRFCSERNCRDGANAFGGLTIDAKGVLYGSTVEEGRGDPDGGGVAYALVPDNNGARWTERVLHRFCFQNPCLGGNGPYGTLFMDKAGHLFGTTKQGGSAYAGTVFELTPNRTDTDWTETALYSFCAQKDCADGWWPHSRVTPDKDGNLYGTTEYTGALEQNFHGGTVYRLVRGTDGWTAETLYRFCRAANCTDGDRPYGGVVVDRHGNVFGTTIVGGAHNLGTVFELTPTAHGWHERVIYNFCSEPRCADGYYPSADVILMGDKIYGTTEGGGSVGYGTAFEVAPTTTGQDFWEEKVLHSFCSLPRCADGLSPFGGLLPDTAGNLYGLTSYSADDQLNPIDGGAAYKLAKDKSGGWHAAILHRFCQNEACSDGAGPYGSLVVDGAGNLYGTTAEGGINDSGTVFKLTCRGHACAKAFAVGSKP